MLERVDIEDDCLAGPGKLPQQPGGAGAWEVHSPAMSPPSTQPATKGLPLANTTQNQRATVAVL